MQVASAIQKFRTRFTGDRTMPEMHRPVEDLVFVINAVRELDRRTTEWERKGIARAD